MFFADGEGNDNKSDDDEVEVKEGDDENEDGTSRDDPVRAEDEDEPIWPTSPVDLATSAPQALYDKAAEVAEEAATASTRAASIVPLAASVDGPFDFDEEAELEASVRVESLRLENRSLLRKCRALEGALAKAQHDKLQPPPPPLDAAVALRAMPKGTAAREAHDGRSEGEARDIDGLGGQRGVIQETVTKEIRATSARGVSAQSGGSAGGKGLHTARAKRPWGAAPPPGRRGAAARPGEAEDLRGDLLRARTRADAEGARAAQATRKLAAVESELAAWRDGPERRSFAAAQHVCTRLQARLSDAAVQAEARDAALLARDLQAWGRTQKRTRNEKPTTQLLRNVKSTHTHIFNSQSLTDSPCQLSLSLSLFPFLCLCVGVPLR
jgi:hypothetical protein